MKIEEFDNAEERTVLSAMIVDDVVLSRLSSRWDVDDGMFSSKWANIVAGWCVAYGNQYGNAPGVNVGRLYDSWASSGKRDQDTLGSMDSFLSGLSREWEATGPDSVNSDYVLDIAGKYFNRVALLRLADTIRGDIDMGNASSALDRIDAFSRVELGGGSAVDVFNDMSALQAAFESTDEPPTIEWRGDLGRLYGRAFDKDSFVSFLAPEKRGKTFWLGEVAMEAARQRKRVAFFSVGDMSEKQMLRRFAIRSAGRPMVPKTVSIPTDLKWSPDGKGVVVERRTITYEDKLSWKAVWEANQRKMKGRTGAYLKLSTHPNSSITVSGIDSILRGWKREGWHADVVVVDYADILANPLPGAADNRDQINTTWKQLRAMSQRWHNCVVTATQSDAGSYDATTIGRRNFSEDKRKFAHVSAMFGINQTEAEKKKGLQRINCVMLREDEYIETRCCHVAGCLGVGAPVILSLMD